MRCHDVKQLLAHQSDADALSDAGTLEFQEHLSALNVLLLKSVNAALMNC